MQITELEDYHRGYLCTSLSLEHALCVEAKHRGDDVVGEAAHHNIILLNRLVILLALNRYAILRALELSLKLQEGLVCLQVGIALRNSK